MNRLCLANPAET